MPMISTTAKKNKINGRGFDASGFKTQQKKRIRLHQQDDADATTTVDQNTRTIRDDSLLDTSPNIDRSSLQHTEDGSSAIDINSSNLQQTYKSHAATAVKMANFGRTSNVREEKLFQ